MGAMVASEREVVADARLALGTAGACLVTYLVFVALPLGTDGVSVPEVVHGPWAVGVAVAMYVSPVAAGLAAWASLSALVTRARTLTTATRRLHVATLVLATAHLVLCFATLGAAQVWLD